jgi:enoyl-CoA hydratase/carnithine racemase
MPIHYDKHGRIATITIDRPEAMNALDVESNQAMADVWAAFRDDPELWVAILTGSGERAFCAGADLKKLIPARSEAARRGTSNIPSFGGITRDYVTWKPLIAAINGVALGGGTEIALACDIRVASENARFGQTEVKWGIIPGAGGTQRLPRLIPFGKAVEMILTGEQIDAQEALRIGLVTHVVPLADLQRTALAIAETLLERGPLALRAAKQAMLEGWDLPLTEGLKLEARLMQQVLRSEDAQEGPRAFAEKRKPEFQAR